MSRDPTLAFALLLVGISVCYGALHQVSPPSFYIVETDAFDSKTQWAIITVDYDAQPYLSLRSGGVLSNVDYINYFNLTSPMFTGVLRCPGMDNPCEDGTDKEIGVVMAVPPTPSPIQPLAKNFVDLLATAFAENPFGWSVSSSTLNVDVGSPIPRRYTGVVQISTTDLKTQQRTQCIPESMLWNGQCQFQVPPPFAVNAEVWVSSIVDSTGLPVNLTQGVVVPAVPRCDATQLAQVKSQLDALLDFDPMNVDNLVQLIINSLLFQVKSLDAAVVNCTQVFGRVAVIGESLVTVANTPVCHRPLFNTSSGQLNNAFVSDPCCNPALSFSMCCTPRQVSFNSVGIQDIRQEQFNQLCPSGSIDRMGQALLDANQVLASINDKCESNYDWSNINNWFTYLYGPAMVCFRDIFASTCNTDADCTYTKACINGACAPPLANPGDAFATCLVNNLEDLTVRYWLNQFNIPYLNGEYNQTAFSLKLKQQLFTEDVCVGFFDDMSQAPQTEAECNSVHKCNWNPSLDQTTCLADVATEPNFCGLCLTPTTCWSVTTPAACILFQYDNALTCVANSGTWAPKYEVCVNTSADTQTPCEDGGGLWFDGYYNTPDKCSQGLCPSLDFGTSRTECEQSHHCTAKCQGCTTDSQFTQMCYTKAYNNDAACFIAGGYPDPSITTNSLCYLVGMDASACTNTTGAIWVSCAGLASGSCASNEINALLQCYVGEVDCMTEVACVAQGQCNDNVFNPDGVAGATIGVCLRDYNVDVSGAINCEFGDNNNWLDARIGCATTDVGQVACALRQFQWVTKSTTQQQCESLRACWEPVFERYTLKDQSECVACGGYWVSVFEWTPGRWLTGSPIDLEWSQKSYSQVYNWQAGLTFDEHSLLSILNVLTKPLGAQMAWKAKSFFLCFYNSITGVVQNIANACSNDMKRATDVISTGNEVAQARVFSGNPAVIQGFSVVVTTNGNTVSGSTEYSDVSITTYPAGQIPQTATEFYSMGQTMRSVWEQIQSKRMPAGVELQAYAVTGDSYKIGLVVSDGVMVEFSPSNTGSYKVCLEKRSDVDLSNACWTTPDFATFTNGYLMPLNMAVTNNGGVICGNFTTSMTTPYYAIHRVNDWRSKTSDQCMGMATTGATTMYTTTTAGMSTSSPSSAMAVLPWAVACCLAVLFALLM